MSEDVGQRLTALKGEVDDALAQAKPAMDYVAFCDRVYQVFPDHRQHRLAESIVMRLAKEAGRKRSTSTSARAA